MKTSDKTKSALQFLRDNGYGPAADELQSLQAELTRLKTIIRRNTGVDLEGGK